MPGMGDEMDGAMQQAPQFLRQFMIKDRLDCEFSILHVQIFNWA
jgi:hypothetical protein